MNKDDKKKYTFNKLKRNKNYKKWSRKIIFVLQYTELIKYVTDKTVMLVEYTSTQKFFTRRQQRTKTE